MDTFNQITDTLKAILSDECTVLTNIEDQYVYSFEKIYLEEMYPKPDIIIKLPTDEIEKIVDWAKNEDVQVLQRGKKIEDKSERTIVVLLDSTQIPDLDRIPTDQDMNQVTEMKFYDVSTPINRSLALRSLFYNNAGECTTCSTCSGYCTVSPSFNGIETWSSKGRALLIKGMTRGLIPQSEKAIDVLYTCTKCGHCFAQCFPDIKLDQAILAMRNDIAEKKNAPEIFHTLANNIQKYGNPSGTPIKRRQSWMKQLPSKSNADADHLLWVGCMTATRTPKTAKAMYNIMNQTNVGFDILGKDEGCCGYVLLASGLWKEAKQVALNVLENIEETGISTLVTPCAGCYYSFSRLYPEILDITLPVKVIHSTELFEQQIKAGKLKFKDLDKTITYHDPCSLGRHCKIFDAPRNILNAIPKLNLIEMQHREENSRCCGGGGGLWAYNNKVSMDTTLTKLQKDVQPLDVNSLVTACPQCQINFRFSSKKNAVPLVINDITEIIEEAMFQ
ncbi:MAG: (Fe-S)-binding protein [Candidatus Kariarchaeaceae archaeon]|jgi:Fe-S oxidoreductase